MEGWQFVTPNSGNKLVSNGLPLDGYLFNPIDRDQFGNPILGDQFVFTGTDEFGNKIVNLTCDNWTETYGHNPRSGRLDLTNENWTNYISDACNTDHRLYCFKQGAIVIPSPSF